MHTNYLKTKLLSLLVLLVLSGGHNLRAQQLQASLAHYSVDNGLPSDAVARLDKDDYGFLWLATWNGISRFDGYNFYNYKTGKASGIRGLHNRVDYMTIDLAQNVWLKMYDGHVFVINRKTDRLEDPLEGVGEHGDLQVDYFFAPYVTKRGEVLISYGKAGLYKLRLDRTGYKQDLIITGNLTVNCVVEGYRSDVWVGTDNGLHRINVQNLTIDRNGYLENENIKYLATNGYNIFLGTKSGKIYQFSYGQEPVLLKDWGKEITGLFVDSHGVIWFSDLGDGAYRLRVETGDVKFFNQRVLVPEFTSRGAEFTEALGHVWVRMNHGGYGYYNRETDEVEYFHNDPSNPWNLSNSVNARLEMNDGVVWESTIRRGLEKLEVLKRTITRTLVLPDSDSPMDNEIRAMCYDKQRHHTLIANKHGSIFIYDDLDNLVGRITHDENGKPIGRPYGMSVDSKGNYWVCDKDNGVYKISTEGPGKYKVQNFCHNDKDKWSLSNNAAYQAVEDRDGNIWVATYGGGVNILQKKDGRYIALHPENIIKSYPAGTYRKVRTITVDKQNKVWVGTTDGILIMTMKNNRVYIEPLQEPEELEDGLQSTDIVYMTCDKNGTVWVGTNSGGLSHTTKQEADGTWHFKTYSTADGLPSEEIRSITFDEKGNAWFATDHVLCSFDVKRKILTTFSQLDGVDDTMCSEGSAIMAGNGKILFGTMNGFYTIDRRRLTTSTGSLLKLRITDFYLDDVLQSPRLTSNYDYYVPESKSVTIAKEANSFAFRFAALNYSLQHRLVYQHMLEGYDDDWQNTNKTRTARYENVPAGKYVFKVKTFLQESPEAYDMRTIEVVVESRFWTTTLPWILTVLLVLGTIGGGLWWYLKKRPQYLAKTEDSPAEKENIAPKEETEEKTDEYEIIES